MAMIRPIFRTHQPMCRQRPSVGERVYEGRESGAVAIMLLTLLPVVVALVGVALASYLLLAAHDNTLHRCRERLLEIENARLDRLNALLKLNPSATRLRLEHAHATQALAAAVPAGPLAVAAARARLQKVIARQIALSSKQKQLIQSTNSSTAISLRSLRSEIGARYRHTARLYGAPAETPAIGTVRALSGPLGAQPIQPWSLTPDYVASNLERQHVIRLWWQVRAAHMLPAWIKAIVESNESGAALSFDAQCATTAEEVRASEKINIKRPLKGKDKPWRARLEKDKPGRSSLS